MSALALAAVGAILAALGQLCFKFGADGRTGLAEFVNIWIASGLLLYGTSTAAWIKALSAAPLTAIYPFTALTYVLVIILGAAILNEDISNNSMIGAAIVLLGLVVMRL